MKYVELETVNFVSNEVMDYIKHTNDILRHLKGNDWHESDVYNAIYNMRSQLRECDVKFDHVAGVAQ